MDQDRSQIWDMLVRRDIDAFVAADWSMVADDFDTHAFFGVDARKRPNPDEWKLGFPDLESYKAEWLRQADEFGTTEFAEDARAAIFNATRLVDIDIEGARAIARKKFDGRIRKADGGEDRLLWQTLYYCVRKDGRWKICGFTGYLPNPLGAAS
ncbi:hypothetical protein ON753_10855 [Roseibium sp. DSM 29163]|uniref:SnoaL-like domain-containing protein n=2 Tax=Roseibium salinum TaxID=1604349 RepID=A0ABT3R0V4_9HYPH|nr:hypothetical protein [Roseibium sp. DSM 29163]MCX2722871.1 hypothetical protein [Roseibium sp. DSM 29163]